MKVRNRMLEREFVLPSDQKLFEDGKITEEEQTKFVIKGLTYDTQVRLQGSIAPTMILPAGAVGKGEKAWENAMENSPVEMKLSGNTALQFEILNEGLVDVIGLIDADTDEPVVFPKTSRSNSVKKEWFQQWLPDDCRTAVANEIQKGSILDEGALKNS